MFTMDAREPPMSGCPVGDRHRAVLVDVHLRTRLAADVEPEPAGDSASPAAMLRRGVVRMGLGGVQRFFEANPSERRPIRCPRAFPSGVPETERDGVDTEFPSQFVDDGLDAERGDGRAGRPVGVALGPVRHHVVAHHF